jgi:NitT/TauT family transport system substrate-binding protein
MTSLSISRARFAALSAGMLAAAPTLASAQQARTTLKVGTLPIDNGAEILYAVDRGNFRSAGIDIDLQMMNSGGAIVAAVSSGALDIGFSNLFSIVTAFSKGIPIQVIAPAALYDSETPAQVLLVRKDGPIKTGKDFNNTTIAVNGIKGITQITAGAYIDANGGDSSTVHWLEMPDPLMTQALTEKRVDAASAAISDNPEAGSAGSPIRIYGLPYDSVGKRFLASGWFASKAWTTAHPDLVKKFADAIVAAGKWANANKGASGSILAKYTKMTPERLALIAKNRAVYDDRPLNPAALSAVIAFAAKEHLIGAPFPATSLAAQ